MPLQVSSKILSSVTSIQHIASSGCQNRGHDTDLNSIICVLLSCLIILLPFWGHKEAENSQGRAEGWREEETVEGMAFFPWLSLGIELCERLRRGCMGGGQNMKMCGFFSFFLRRCVYSLSAFLNPVERPSLTTPITPLSVLWHCSHGWGPCPRNSSIYFSAFRFKRSVPPTSHPISVSPVWPPTPSGLPSHHPGSLRVGCEQTRPFEICRASLHKL